MRRMLDARYSMGIENFLVISFFPDIIRDPGPDIIGIIPIHRDYGQVAQSVEQRTENPCVGGSIPPLPIFVSLELSHTYVWHFFIVGI